MLKVVADLLAPHYCCSCGTIGAVLCEHCKYDIMTEPFGRCIVCTKPVSDTSALCSMCTVPYSRAWCVGSRDDSLKLALNRYKFKSARATSRQLVDLLDVTIPLLSDDVRVMAVPTVAPHMRQRGFDHTAHLATQFAYRRGLRVASNLTRRDKSMQRGATKTQRIAQAKRAFTCEAAEPVPYLLIDDVYTTGATVYYAAKTLREAGASDVYVAILARQPLENE